MSFSPKNISYWLQQLLIFPFLTLGLSKSKSQEWEQEGPVYSGLPWGLPAQVTCCDFAQHRPRPPCLRRTGRAPLAARVKPQTRPGKQMLGFCVGSVAKPGTALPTPCMRMVGTEGRWDRTEFWNFCWGFRLTNAEELPPFSARVSSLAPTTAAPCLLKFQRRQIFVTAHQELPIKLEDTDYFEGDMQPVLVKINHFKSKLSVTFFLASSGK